MDGITNIDPAELAERLRLAWDKWAELNGEAMASKKEMERTFAQLVINSNLKSTSKAQAAAEANETYKEAVDRWVKAETEANKAKGLRESIGVYIDLIRSLESSKREQLKRLGG